ncbi:MAG: hypothetical protein KAR33_07345 [Candidatus Thorarchaeota archaeon]|nr:hypothetical protein [Candidatus Thorarchaeota archaeon]
MRFLAKAFKHSRSSSNTFAAEVPKNAILFYGINPETYAERWYLAGAIRARPSPYHDFVTTTGEVEYDSTRNTLRFQFLYTNDDISECVLDFWFSQDGFETSDS